MGKLMHNTQIKHSSHPHLLQLSSNLQLQNNISCAGCNHPLTSSDHLYACRPCNFFLHASCSKFPELITHPSHRQHTLSLLPTSIYPGGFFRCDACTQQGTRFSYHCHAQTYWQTPVGVPSYQRPPQQQAPAGFQTYQGPPQPQPQQQAPVGYPQPQQQAPVGYPRPLTQQQPPVGFQTARPQQPAPVGGQNYQMQPAPAAANQSMADVMVTGFVDGMMQQIGQNFVQSLTGGGGGGGDVVNVNVECSNTNDYECATVNDYECSTVSEDY
ncbi:putative chromatin regulator PHD family [Helianthus annuus]|uniref:Chromatin regulator PHD family n=1 Tax=Helianthus annuus TaxID=4232 RepID=A0A9K3IFH9_HELAN|nr:putative chromatin regulator PHD family [Helianthus annuus]KAJ0901867.1 putative chromatin regulator PHD family [Helianthus annuus]